MPPYTKKQIKSMFSGPSKCVKCGKKIGKNDIFEPADYVQDSAFGNYYCRSCWRNKQNDPFDI